MVYNYYMKNKMVKIASLVTCLIISFFLIESNFALATNHNTNVQKTNTNTNTKTNQNSNSSSPQTTVTSSAPEYKEDGSGGFVPCGNTAGNPCNITHLFRAFVVIVNYMITMAGFVAVVAIAYAGFLMVVSQGEAKLVEAKGRFAGAIIGLVLTAVAFVLVNTLFEGSLRIGVINGTQILTSPLDYIKGQ